jgi:transcriptional regulator with XRE-family HTH domain
MDSLVDPRDSALVASVLVRVIKRRLGGSLADVAAALGLSVKTLGRWEAGTHGVSSKNLALLAKEAGYSPALVQRLVMLLGLLRHSRPEASAGSSTSSREPITDRVIAAAAVAIREARALLPLEPAPEVWEDQVGREGR